MIRNHIMISKKQLLDSDGIATSVGTSEVHEQRRKLRDIPCNDGVPKHLRNEEIGDYFWFSNLHQLFLLKTVE